MGKDQQALLERLAESVLSSGLRGGSIDQLAYAAGVERAELERHLGPEQRIWGMTIASVSRQFDVQLGREFPEPLPSAQFLHRLGECARTSLGPGLALAGEIRSLFPEFERVFLGNLQHQLASRMLGEADEKEQLLGRLLTAIQKGEPLEFPA